MDGVTGEAPSALARLGEMAQLGGPVVGLLLAMAVVLLAVAALKLVQFRALRIESMAPVEAAVAAYRAGEPDAPARLDEARNPAATVVAEAMRRHRAGADPELAREEALTSAADHTENLRSHLRVLEIIATLSPLLGLFGTVLGMIEAFQQMEAAGNRVDPAVLSGGIWQALLTTAVGLGVAIPATAVFTWLERRVERFAQATESALTRVFTAPLATRPVAEEAAHAPSQAVA